MDLILPYKIGDLAETRSFVEGYRGAWFRCKINDMRVTDTGHFECYLEYIDYPGESKEWIRLFQMNPFCSKQQPTEQIMIRPSFPQWHWKANVPWQLPNNDVIAIVDENWKVGDMVDWLSEGCYWSGKITKLLNEDKVEVELLQPPIGEGQRYKANVDDLRPTLDWSLAGGWTVPLSQAKGKGWHVVRVIHRKSAASEEMCPAPQPRKRFPEKRETSSLAVVMERWTPFPLQKLNVEQDGASPQFMELEDKTDVTSFYNEESDTSDSGDETSSDDGDKSDNGDSQDMQLQMISSNTSLRAPGPPGSMIPKPSSAAKSMTSLNAQRDDTLRPMADLKPSSSSKSAKAG